jgi:hypothetical protein
MNLDSRLRGNNENGAGGGAPIERGKVLPICEASVKHFEKISRKIKGFVFSRPLPDVNSPRFRPIRP